MLIFALLVSLGTLAHWLAWSLRVPLVLALLGFGAGLQALVGVPGSELNDALQPLVGICLSVVFFEGGCALARRDLGDDSHLVGHLVAIGPKLGWLLIAGLAMLILGMEPLLALTCGAFLLIGAPYLIEGMVLRLGGDDRLARILHWEAFLVSCVGGAWTVLMANAICEDSGHPSLVKTLVATVLTVAAGLAVAWLVGFLMRAWLDRMPEDLVQPLGISLVFLAFGVAQAIYRGAGLVAVIRLGYVVSRSGQTVREPLFWSSMRTLAVGVLGVYLGMAIPPVDLTVEWPRHLLFALVLVLGVRPFLVMVAARKSGLDRRRRFVLGLVAPRGPIFLACAAMVAQMMVASNLAAEAEQALQLAYWVTLVSTVLPWVLGPWLLRMYGQDPAAA